MTIKNETPPLETLQDAVMADYQRAPIFQTNRRAQESLHMFFSPNRVPVGLTDNEVAICIRLYPYRERMIKKINAEEDAKLEQLDLTPYPSPTLTDALTLVEEGVHETVEEATEHLECLWRMAENLRCHPIRILSLPSELDPAIVMTRERFRRGIRLFIAEYRRRCEI